MLWELGARFPQRTFPEQDQIGQALLIWPASTAKIKDPSETEGFFE
jgi:hypothetical protein